jgi:outer membrane protein
MKKELEKKYKETEGYRKLILDSILGELKSKAQVSNSSSTDELSMLKREFLTKKELFDKENTESMNQYNEQIWNQLNEYTAQYSKDKEYDFVFGANGQGVLMYAKDTKNVTKELLEFVNEKYNGK